MRLWHQYLIPYLDFKRLMGQHRECCALRGKGWGRKHATVDYVFKYTLSHLYEYHCEVMSEIARRTLKKGIPFHINTNWYSRTYRGMYLPCAALTDVGPYVYNSCDGKPIYEEHDDRYLKECLLNLKAKGAELTNGKTIDEMLLSLDLKGI